MPSYLCYSSAEQADTVAASGCCRAPSSIRVRPWLMLPCAR